MKADPAAEGLKAAADLFAEKDAAERNMVAIHARESAEREGRANVVLFPAKPLRLAAVLANIAASFKANI